MRGSESNADLRQRREERAQRARVHAQGYPIEVRLRDGVHIEATVEAGTERIPLALLALCNRIRIARGDAGYDVVHDTSRHTPYWEAK